MHQQSYSEHEEYHTKYGQYTAVDNYMINFEPFAVMKFITVE